ncbi:MAG: hypothetical protein FWG44_01835 [Oscillospiraceae bacterium]|nr:hypothetical protein [Oscillospiraceae bacterium]
MATINNTISANYVSSNKMTKNEIDELRKKINDLDKDSTLTAEQRTAKKKEYNEQIDALKEETKAGQSASLGNLQGGMMGLFGGNTDLNQTGFDFFFGAGASMTSLKTINSARLGIESRARTLMSEIRMDQLRGADTSYKREQLANLTENLNIMDKNLSNNIDKAIKDPLPADKNQPSIIDKINADLKKIQEQEEKKVQEKYGEREAPEETNKD